MSGKVTVVFKVLTFPCDVLSGEYDVRRLTTTRA